jgi:ApbE superfamily uncharacterized protein (UPF0280 family)
MDRPQASLLSDGRRLHLNHGPIDLIIEAFGEAQEVRQHTTRRSLGFRQFWESWLENWPSCANRRRFIGAAFFGSTARRMEAAVAPLARDFITPMAAVAERSRMR